MRIIDDEKLDFSDVLILPKRSELDSRIKVNLIREYKFLHGSSWKGFGIIAANMDTIGTFKMAARTSVNAMMTALHKHYSIEELVNFYKTSPNVSHTSCWYTMGTSDKDWQKYLTFCEQLNYIPKFLCIDIANGYSEHLVEHVKKVREARPDVALMVGNVVTPEMTEALIFAGADIVKVGIGPGSVCTTRKLTGVGYPQLSAIIECADAAHGLKGHICADGGCVEPGDIGKAFGAGADFVMLGGMLAGHDECGGQLSAAPIKKLSNDVSLCFTDGLNCEGYCYKDNKYCNEKDLPSEAFELVYPPGTTMSFYGMSSETAMNKHNGGVADYRTSEGKTVQIPYRGPVDNTLKKIAGGVRSTCTYTGSLTIKELPKRTTFIKVRRQLNNVFGS